ncbi:hypothetical protein [Pseudoxanthomonas composti]|uniref:hypothetical protein n=1 Tax=Pseudoxanthomonas composti TaxID=2137479 RepID=UPI001F50DAE1|nr:hypothetical protein [Pseudoxanthomonas composti]
MQRVLVGIVSGSVEEGIEELLVRVGRTNQMRHRELGQLITGVPKGLKPRFVSNERGDIIVHRNHMMWDFVVHIGAPCQSVGMSPDLNQVASTHAAWIAWDLRRPGRNEGPGIDRDGAIVDFHQHIDRDRLDRIRRQPAFGDLLFRHVVTHQPVLKQGADVNLGMMLSTIL